MKRRIVMFILAFFGSLLLIIMACFIACAPSSFCFFVDRWASQPDWSPDGQRIAFTCHYPSLSQVWEDMPSLSRVWESKGKVLLNWSHVPEATEICTVQADGGSLTRLTNNQVSDGGPVWSPDGQLVAYLSGAEAGTEIHIITQDGSPLTILITNISIEGKPAWALDGDRICFAAKDPAHPDQGINLYVAVLESEEIYALTTLPGDELECQWSPNGTQVAFVWFAEGFRWLLSNNAAVRITDTEGRGSVALVEGFAGIGGLTWNRDGTHLAFWAYESPDCVYDYHCTEVYVVDLSDGSIACLTEQYEIGVLFETAWSPDGERIVFTARAPEGPGIYTVAPDGEELSRIAPSGISDYGLTWAPDGEFIAFVRGIEGDKSRIWLVQMETGDLRELEIP